MKKNKDGTWTEISYERKGNYLVFITDTLGQYSIVTETSNTSVQGTYTPNVGGANTGYRPIFSSYLFYFLISFIVLCLLLKKHQQNKNDCA
jgi:Tol biopolymer transport system component